MTPHIELTGDLIPKIGDTIAVGVQSLLYPEGTQVLRADGKHYVVRDGVLQPKESLGEKGK